MENKECMQLGISAICPYAERYERFKKLLDEYLLSDDFEWRRQKEYVKIHLYIYRIVTDELW